MEKARGLKPRKRKAVTVQVDYMTTYQQNPKESVENYRVFSGEYKINIEKSSRIQVVTSLKK